MNNTISFVKYYHVFLNKVITLHVVIYVFYLFIYCQIWITLKVTLGSLPVNYKLHFLKKISLQFLELLQNSTILFPVNVKAT